MRSIIAALGIVALSIVAIAQSSMVRIPKTFDDQAIATLEVPLAVKTASPVQTPSKLYYSASVAPIYKSYPIYRPDKEPPGYIEWLKQQEPQIVFDASALKGQADWIQAGELVFDQPIAYTPLDADSMKQDVRNRRWYDQTEVPVVKDGTLPFLKYVIREKGKVEIGSFSCGSCHTRVMPDGTVIKGAQGNFPFDRAFAWNLRNALVRQIPGDPLTQARIGEKVLYAAPWIQGDENVDQLSLEEIAARHEAIPPGVMARHGTSPLSPTKVPDLIGVRDRRYLDATGLVRHREIDDLMRYAALNQGADFSARYGSFIPAALFAPGQTASFQPTRYSDEQLYALALYVYSLQPPKNPNRFDSQTARGQKIFEREGCAGCHTPPLYTNNKLTLAKGFTPTSENLTRLDILPISVGTDPNLALKTRRGTGYYKVPSLKGVWYRGPFEHNGSVANLEDWFDPSRLRDDYVPTGFRGAGVKARAVKGHEFGLSLSAEDKRALIAFLKSL
jgi:Di-haem oxidoreductase, putative peroxidase